MYVLVRNDGCFFRRGLQVGIVDPMIFTVVDVDCIRRTIDIRYHSLHNVSYYCTVCAATLLCVLLYLKVHYHTLIICTAHTHTAIRSLFGYFLLVIRGMSHAPGEGISRLD